jgi:GAF domain-containing protein
MLALDAMAVGPLKGSCGAAAHANRRIIVEDVVTDARWVALRTVALSHGIRACWAQPVQRAAGPLVGIFAIHYHEPRGPTPAEVQLVEAAAPLVGIGLERVRKDEERQRHTAQVEEARARADERVRQLEQEAIELLHARDQAQAASRANLNLLADMTHELRTRATLSESLGDPGEAELSREIAGPGGCSDVREPAAPIEVESR